MGRCLRQGEGQGRGVGSRAGGGSHQLSGTLPPVIRRGGRAATLVASIIPPALRLRAAVRRDGDEKRGLIPRGPIPPHQVASFFLIDECLTA